MQIFKKHKDNLFQNMSKQSWEDNPPEPPQGDGQSKTLGNFFKEIDERIQRRERKSSVSKTPTCSATGSERELVPESPSDSTVGDKNEEEETEDDWEDDEEFETKPSKMDTRVTKADSIRQ